MCWGLSVCVGVWVCIGALVCVLGSGCVCQGPSVCWGPGVCWSPDVCVGAQVCVGALVCVSGSGCVCRGPGVYVGARCPQGTERVHRVPGCWPDPLPDLALPLLCPAELRVSNTPVRTADGSTMMKAGGSVPGPAPGAAAIWGPLSIPEGPGGMRNQAFSPGVEVTRRLRFHASVPRWPGFPEKTGLTHGGADRHPQLPSLLPPGPCLGHAHCASSLLLATGIRTGSRGEGAPRPWK